MEDEALKLAIPTSVRERRKARGWTQPELGERANISTTAVHNLEAGKNGFTDKTLAALAAALECRPADLLLPFSTGANAPESSLRAALLAYGVDKDDLDQVIGIIDTFAPAEQPEETPSPADAQPSSPRREPARSK